MPGGVLPPSSNRLPGQRAGSASAYQLATAASTAGFPLSALPTAVAIALAESGGAIGATNHNSNGTVDHGAWQINDVNLRSVGYTGAQLQSSLQDNANAAFKIWKAAGGSFSPWTTYKTGVYKQFLSVGKSAASTAAGVKSAAAPDPVTGAVGSVAGAVGSVADIPGAISGVFNQIVNDAKYAVVLVVVLFVAGYLIVRGGTGGGGRERRVPVPV